MDSCPPTGGFECDLHQIVDYLNKSDDPEFADPAFGVRLDGRLGLR